MSQSVCRLKQDVWLPDNVVEMPVQVSDQHILGSFNRCVRCERGELVDVNPS